MARRSLERYLISVLTYLIRDLEARLVRIECKLDALESRIGELKEDMRKILERDRSRRWPI